MLVYMLPCSLLLGSLIIMVSPPLFQCLEQIMNDSAVQERIRTITRVQFYSPLATCFFLGLFTFDDRLLTKSHTTLSASSGFSIFDYKLYHVNIVQGGAKYLG